MTEWHQYHSLTEAVCKNKTNLLISLVMHVGVNMEFLFRHKQNIISEIIKPSMTHGVYSDVKNRWISDVTYLRAESFDEYSISVIDFPLALHSIIICSWWGCLLLCITRAGWLHTFFRYCRAWKYWYKWQECQKSCWKLLLKKDLKWKKWTH